jgi:two-component system, cell cycle response regulator DivK
VPKTVLIVDGNPHLRALLASVLQREGFQSLEASTGMETIRKAIAEKPDVIMLDLELPDMEGAKVARILKNHSHTATIPIVGWTGYIGTDHKRSALSTGMVGYLVKPLSLATIPRTLDQFIFSPR